MAFGPFAIKELAVEHAGPGLIVAPAIWIECSCGRAWYSRTRKKRCKCGKQFESSATIKTGGITTPSPQTLRDRHSGTF
jgi:hypothetical protein